MSTQHTGDGPPGDDDYYNPVEENIKPSGSGFNPNAAAWDPEKINFGRTKNNRSLLTEAGLEKIIRSTEKNLLLLFFVLNYPLAGKKIIVILKLSTRWERSV